MGVRLIVEILDHWQDAGLTAGERADLLVLAENANDGTRETVGPVHEEYILKRAGKKATGWRASIGALKRKGVLEYATRNGREMSGFPGQHAVYRIAVLCPQAPHDGYKGMCTRPERVSPRHTQSDADPESGGPRAHPIAGMGVPSAHERVSSQHTPTPQDSSTTSPLSVPERVVRTAAVVAVEEEREFIAWITDKHQPRGPGWWKTVARNGDLPDLAAAWRADKPRPSPASSLPAWCEECNDRDPAARFNARLRLTPTGDPCPNCHPDAPAAQAA